MAEQTNQALLALARDTAKEVERAPLLVGLTRELSSFHVPCRLIALKWINMLLEKSPQEMTRFIGELLPALLRTLSDDSDEVRAPKATRRRRRAFTRPPARRALRWCCST